MTADIAHARKPLSAQEAFDALGVKMPDTKQAFREIADSLAMIDLFTPARKRIAESIDANAAKAIAEIRAMGERSRRSLGQIIRHRVTECRRMVI